MQHSLDFVYYSFDFTRMIVTGGINSKGDVVFTADVCERCMEGYKKLVTAMYAPPKPGVFKCEITGEVFSGNFIWHSCDVSKITVGMTGRPLICTKCSVALAADAKECKCGCSILRRDADVDVDKEYLEINFSDKALQKLIENVEKVRKLGALEWKISTDRQNPPPTI
jgi:hypothetical protein